MDRRRKQYFIKQKLIGAAMVLLSILTVIMLEGDATAAVFMTPIGLMTIFTKDMVITDSYFFEMKSLEENDEEL